MCVFIYESVVIVCVLNTHTQQTHTQRSAAPPAARGKAINNPPAQFPAHELAIENAPVQLVMTLGLDFSTAGTQFTCFTSTNVQILTRGELRAGSEGSDKRETFKRDVAHDLASASGKAPYTNSLRPYTPVALRPYALVA